MELHKAEFVIDEEGNFEWRCPHCCYRVFVDHNNRPIGIEGANPSIQHYGVNGDASMVGIQAQIDFDDIQDVWKDFLRGLG